MIQQIPIEKLYPHPDNRPLGINEEKVEQLAEMMKVNGYDQSKPIKARPNGKPDAFQIIEGEHRWRAAQKAGIESVPVFVKELSDEDALIELVAGNVQTGYNHIDVGMLALRIKDDNKVASKIGKERTYVVRSRKGTEAWELLEGVSRDTLGAESRKLYEISKLNSDYDKKAMADIIVSRSYSVIEVQECVKKFLQIDTTTAPGHAAQVFDLTEVKKECATAKERIYNYWISLLESVEDCAGKLPEEETLYKYVFASKSVEQYEYKPRETFLSILSELKEPTRADVFKHYNFILETIRQQTKENADKDKKHYEAEGNRQAAEERAKAEWEAFMPEPGKWYELGPHRLYCGDNRDPEFINALPEDAAFAFADPPYNAGVDEWDTGFFWDQDYLQDKAELVFVTPGISNIDGMFQNTKMNYKWSLAAWITNGMTRGALGFGNWIYIALFSAKESVHNNEQDFLKVNISNPANKEHTHRGEKPKELLDRLVEKFSKEGDCIVDPFLGSGTTLFSCDDQMRICYAAEKNPQYCKNIMAKFRK